MTNFSIVLIAALTAWLGRAPEQARINDVEAVAPLFLEYGQRGAIVSPQADPFILASVAFYESRIRPGVRDGDCRRVGGMGLRTRCDSVGLMQISTGAPQWMFYLGEEWQGLTVAKLRTPRTSVRAAYSILSHHHQKCGSSVAIALDAYGRGRCPKYAIPSWRGIRRCALAAAMAARAGYPFKCGHEGKKTLKVTARVVEALSR